MAVDPEVEALIDPLGVYGGGAHPAVVFCHGGGWVVGDRDSHDDICGAITNASGCVVVRGGPALAGALGATPSPG